MFAEHKPVGAKAAPQQLGQAPRERAGSANVGGRDVVVIAGHPDGDVAVASRSLQDASQLGQGGDDVKEDFSAWYDRQPKQQGAGNHPGQPLAPLIGGADDESDASRDDLKLGIEPKPASKPVVGDAVPQVPDEKDGPVVLGRDSLVDRVQATNTRWKQAGAAVGGGAGQGLVRGAAGAVVGTGVGAAGALLGGKIGAFLGATAFSWTVVGIPIAASVGAVLGAGIGGAIGFAIGVYRGTRAGLTHADAKFWSPQKLHLEHAIVSSRGRIGEYSAEEENRLAAVTDEQWRKLLSIGAARKRIKDPANRQLIREAVVRRVATTDFRRALMLKQDLMRRGAVREDPNVVRTAFCEDAFPRSERDAMMETLGLVRDQTLPPDIDQKIDRLILGNEKGNLETWIEALLLEEAQKMAFTKGDRERAMRALGLDPKLDLPRDIDKKIDRLIVRCFRDKRGDDLEKEVSALLVEQVATQAASGDDLEYHQAAARAFAIHAARYSKNLGELAHVDHPGSSQLRKILLKYGGGEIAHKIGVVKDNIANRAAASLASEQGRTQALQNLNMTMTAIVGQNAWNLEHDVQKVPPGVRDLLRPIGQAVEQEVARLAEARGYSDDAPKRAVVAAMYNVFLVHGLADDLVADQDQVRTPEQQASLELNRALVLSIYGDGALGAQAHDAADLVRTARGQWHRQMDLFLRRLGGLQLAGPPKHSI